MNTRRQAAFGRLGLICTGLVIAAVFAGCDKLGAVKEPKVAGGTKFNCKTDVAEWTEGVRLFNGQEVTVWRRAVACAGGFPNSSRGRDLEFELKYEPMGVHWKAPSGLDLVSFELIDGVPHLGLYVMTGGQCKDQPADKALARMVKWVGGQWVDVPLAEAPFDRALVNLHTDYWGATAKGDAKGFIGADGKHTGWSPKMTLKEYFGMERNQCGIYQERVEPMPAVPRAASGARTQR